MSIESISRVLPLQGLPPAEKLCLLGIANHDGDGGAWPSMKTLAMYVGVSERHAQRLVRNLTERGWITVEINAGGTKATRKDQRTNLYRIHFDGVTLMTPRDERGDISAPYGVTPRAPRGDTAMSPEPSLTIHEPSNNDAKPSSSLHALRAAELTKLWWESRAVKPNQTYIAARAVILKALKSGWDPERLLQALLTVPVVSGGALDLWAARHPLPQKRAWSDNVAVDIANATIGGPDNVWLNSYVHRYSGRMRAMHDNGIDDDTIAVWLVTQYLESLLVDEPDPS